MEKQKQHIAHLYSVKLPVDIEELIVKVNKQYVCRQYKIQPRGLNKDKLPLNSEWFDEEQLERRRIKAFSLDAKPSSGPCDTPPERGL